MFALKYHVGLLYACVLIANFAYTNGVRGEPTSVHHYVYASQTFYPPGPECILPHCGLASGTGAIFPQEMPYVPNAKDYASITQLAITKTARTTGFLGICSIWPLSECEQYDARVIEYGWYVIPGDALPHMFLSLRDSALDLLGFQSQRNFYCYIDMSSCNAEGCSCKQPPPPAGGGREFKKAFVPVTGAAAYPGDALSVSEDAFFYIGYFEGNHAWWVQYNDQWIGYIPDTGDYFNERFSEANIVDWYGEINTPEGKGESCVGMGNGYLGTDSRSARITNMLYLNSASGRIESAEAHFFNTGDKPGRGSEDGYLGGFYTLKGMPSDDSGLFDAFHYGGEGWNCSIAR